MDPIIYKKTHKRIRELNPFTPGSPGEDPLESLVYLKESRKWRAVLDKTAGIDGHIPSDSYGIPLSRLVVLSQNRKVPAAFLPSSISSGSDDRIIECEYHSGSTDPREALPDSGDADYGNFGVVYKVLMPSGQSDLFYRYVPSARRSEDEPWYYVYCSIPSKCKYIDGLGTVVHDDISLSSGKYYRQIDIDVGSPIAHRNTLIAINGNADGPLVHTRSAHISSETTEPSSSSGSGFGDAFYILSATLDAELAGHIDNASESELRFPSTAATTSTPGLVTVGTDIKSIASDNDAGTIGPLYTAVAAADHKHKMSALEFTDANTIDGGNITYAGHQPVSYDFRRILYATLPANPPSEASILTSSGATVVDQQGEIIQCGQAAWKPVSQTFHTESFSGSGSRTTVGTSDTTLCTLYGLTTDCIYLVTAQLDASIVAGAGSAQLGPVPTTHSLKLLVGNIDKYVNLPGSWTYDMPWAGTVSWIIKASGPSIVLYGAIEGNSVNDNYTNIFGVQCTNMTAVRLR